MKLIKYKGEELKIAFQETNGSVNKRTIMQIVSMILLPNTNANVNK